MTEIIDINDQGWAKEETLKKLVELMEKNIRGMSRNDAKSYASAVNVGDLKKEKQIRDKNRQAIKETTKELDPLQKELRATRKEFSLMQKALGGLKIAAGVLKGAFFGLVAGVIASGKEMFELSLELERGGLAASLRNYGSSATTALSAIGQASITAGVSVGKFSQILKDYGEAVGRFGIREFARGSDEMYKSTERFGVTTAEAATYLAGYLERQRKAGLLDRLSQKQTSKAATESFKQTIRLAHAMRMSREELEERAKAATEQPDAQFLLNQLAVAGKHISVEFEKVSKALGPDLAAILVEGASASTFLGTSMASEQIQSIIAQGAPNIAMLLAELSDNLAAGKEIDLESVQGRIQALMGSTEMDVVGALRGASKEVRQTIMQLANFATTFKSGAYEEAASEADEAAKTVGKFKTAMGKLTGAFQNFVINLLENPAFLTALNRFLDELVPVLINFINKATESIPKIGEFFDNLPAMFEKLKEHWPIVVTGVATALLAALTAPALIGGIAAVASAGLTRMMTSVLSFSAKSLFEGGKGLFGLLGKAAGGLNKIPGVLGSLGRVAAGGLGGAVAWEAGSWAGDKIYEGIQDQPWFTDLVDSFFDIATGRSSLIVEAAKRANKSQATEGQPALSTPTTPSSAPVIPPREEGSAEQPQAGATQNQSSAVENMINSLLQRPDSKREVELLEDISRSLKTIAKNSSGYVH